MPAGRFVLKSISQSKKLASLSTDGARLLYTWLLPHVDVNGCFSGDAEVINGQIFTRLKKSIKKVEEYLEDLEQNHLIIRYQVKGDFFLHIPDFQEKQPNLNPEKEAKSTISMPPPELLQTYSRATQDEGGKNSALSKVIIKQSKVIISPSSASSELIKKIIDYFNQVTGQKRSCTNKEAVGLINGRIAEGHLFEDFKHVIDTKTSQWRGDPKMSQYIRPSTLFRPGHFEDYLNEPYQDPGRPNNGGGRQEGRASRVGENKYQPTDEEKKRTALIEKKRRELFNKYSQDLEEARKKGNKDAWEKIQADIKIELGEYAQGLQGVTP
jgi:uncharacterized phage protein (TIGR02220 family)